MTRIAQTLGLTEFQTEIISAVRQFADEAPREAAERRVVLAIHLVDRGGITLPDPHLQRGLVHCIPLGDGE